MERAWGGDDGAMTRVCEVSGVSLTIRTASAAQDVSWKINDGGLFSGPARSEIHIGGRVGDTEGDNFFVGSIAGITINRSPIAAHDVECMYLQGEESVGRCSVPRGVVFAEALLEDVPSTPPKTETETLTMYGQTYLDPDFGAVMDGANDYLTFEDAGFTSSNRFTISFWFTRRTECVTSGKWEFMYSEAEHPEAAFFQAPEAAIEVYLGCGVSGADESGRDGNRWRRHEGDVVRTYAQDSCGNTALFDVPVFQISTGGVITSEWTHYMLSVSPRSINTFINGELVPTENVIFAEDGFASNWIRTDRNIAYPDPSSLTNRGFTCDFGLSEQYSGRDTTNIPLDDMLTDGQEYTLWWAAGAEGAFWVGDEAGRTSCTSDACTYVPAADSTCTGTMADGETPCAIEETRRAYGEYACSNNVWTEPADYVEADGVSCTYTAATEPTCGEAAEGADPCAINAGNVLPRTEFENRQPGSVTFTYSASTNTWLSIENGAVFWDSAATIASQMRWTMTDATGAVVGSGPNTGTTFIGGRSDRADDHYFMGSMAGLEVRSTAVDSDAAQCAYQTNEKLLGSCDMNVETVAVNLFSGANLDRQPRWGVSMMGNAHTEDDYGVTLSGDADFVKVEVEDNDYLATGRFALSFWFTKAVCHVPGDYEILFSHHANPEGWSGCYHGADGKCATCNPGIVVYLGCFSDGTDGYTASSTINGDVIRTMITDDDCNSAVFDTPLNRGFGGYLTDDWIHFGLSVWGRGAHTYVDGVSIEPAEIGYPVTEEGSRAERWWNWARSEGNIAWNAVEARGIRNFTTPLGPITAWENYSPGEHYEIKVMLEAGTHTFTPLCGPEPEYCAYSQGWGAESSFTVLAGAALGHCSWDPDGACDGPVDRDGQGAPCHGSEELCTGPCTADGEYPTVWCPSGADTSGDAGSPSDTPHCTWDGSCDSPLVNTDGPGAVCHNSENMCTGPCTGNGQFDTQWCPGNVLVGGGDAGTVETYSQGEFCESGEWFARDDQARCNAESCCEFDLQANQCNADRGSDTVCSITTAPVQFTLASAQEVTVVIDVAFASRSPWAINWKIDEGGYGKSGPVRGALYIGAENENEYSWSSGYMGSMASIKTYTAPMWPGAAKCMFQEAESAVGVCDEVEGVVFEAEFTTRVSGFDEERDLNGAVMGGARNLDACMDFCAAEYSYFGLQWGSSCTCGNDFGQHGRSELDSDCSWPCGGNVAENCEAAHEGACAGVDMLVAADAVAESCVAGIVGDAADCSTFVAGDADSCPAGCEYNAGTDAVDASGNEASCTGTGDCTFAVIAAGCYSTSAEFCDNVDLGFRWSNPCTMEPNMRSGSPGGCLYTAANRTAQTSSSCVAAVTEETCVALDETTCGTTEGCSYRAVEVDTCAATDKDACDGVAMDGTSDTCTDAGATTSGCTWTEPITEMCGGQDLNSIWAVNPGAAGEPVTRDYMGCFLDASSSSLYETFGDATRQADYADAGGFGLTFDGEGDYATLNHVEDFTGDGTFSLSFWFTKTPCNDPDTPYQVLYSHMGANFSWGDPRLMVMVGCSHQGTQSTASAGDVIRVLFSDDDGQQGVFDAPMLDAYGSGFVTSMWVHFVLAMDTDGARVFIDGNDISRDLGFPENNRWIRWAQTPDNLAWPDPRMFGKFEGRDMKGGEYTLRDPSPLSVSHCAFDVTGDGADCSAPNGGLPTSVDVEWCNGAEDRCTDPNGCASQAPTVWCEGATEVDAAPQAETLEGALTECAALCARGGYSFMGLQWTNQCFCDNEYGRRGPAREGSCDVNGDDVVDCGYNVEVVPEWDTREDAEARTACGATNAVYDVAAVTADVTTGYLGCFHDSYEGARDDEIATKTFAGMTMDTTTYTRGGRFNDTGAYLEGPLTLPEGTHHFHAQGTHSGWADGNYFEVWLNDADGAPASVLVGGATTEESCVSPNAGAECPLTAGDDCTSDTCAYTAYEVLQEAGCFASSADYCADVDAGSNWARFVCTEDGSSRSDFNNPGGCLFVAASDAGPATCTAIAQCDGGADADSCGGMEGCEWRAEVVQDESCDALGEEQCDGADIGSRSWYYSQTACTDAWEFCTYTPASNCGACEDAPRGPTGTAPWDFLTPAGVECPLTTDGCDAIEGCSVVGTACMLTHCAACTGSLKSEDKYVPFDVPADSTVTVRIVVASWGNAISWEITDQELSWVRPEDGQGIKRRVIEYAGPIRGKPTLGGAGPDAGWFSSEDYTGSIAAVSMYWRPVDEDAVGCIYKQQENILTTCVPPARMAGNPFYSTMDPRDLSKDYADMGDDMTLEGCADYCADYKYFAAQYGGECYCDNEYGQYGIAEAGCVDDPTGQLEEYGMGCAEWMSTTQTQMGMMADSMDITLPENMCDFDMATIPGWEESSSGRAGREQFGSLLTVFEQQGSAMMSTVCPQMCGTCGSYTESAVEGGSYYTECDKPCNGDDGQICGGGWRNSVYEITGEGMEWTDYITLNGESTWCSDEVFGTSSSGFRAQCQCRGQGRCANERENCVCINEDGSPGQVRYGRPTFEYKGCHKDHGREADGLETFGNTYFDHDFGITFDGEGDYAKLDMSDKRWITNDGSFTLSFWATQSACTVPSWYETIIGWYKYPDMNKWDDRNSHIEVQMGCSSYSHSTVEGNTMRVDLLDDDGGKTVFDVSMDDLPGSENPITDTWVHVVLSISSEEIKVFIDGVDPCSGGGDGGPPRRSSGCDKIGVPDFSDTPWAAMGAWTMTPENGAWSAGSRGRPGSPQLNSARTGTFDLRYGECEALMNPDCVDDPNGDLAENGLACEMFLGMVGPMAEASGTSACELDLNEMNAEAPEGSFVKMLCPETCEYECPAEEPCDPMNTDDERVTMKSSPLFIGGTPDGFEFTGSINGLGIFRYAVDASQANCLFRFGEYDIHVCQDPDDMFGLFYSMTALPAPRLMEDKRLSWRSCRNAEAVMEECVVTPGTEDDESTEATTCTIDAAACTVATGTGSCEYVAPVSMEEACTAASEVPGHCLYTTEVLEPDCSAFTATEDSCPNGCIFTDADASTEPSTDASCVADPQVAHPEGCTNVVGTPDARAVCAAACVKLGYPYMGMEFNNDCLCDDSYSAGGQVADSECDVDKDGTMDCGTFDADWTWYTDPANPCAYRVAVYSVADSCTAPEGSASDLDCSYTAGDASTCTGECTYGVTYDENGCWRDPMGMPAGVTLGGDAYFDDSGRHSGSGVGRGDENSANDFGIHFDGSGDYAAIQDQPSGYASDGTFSIAMWVTKPACQASGREEVLYRHATQDWQNGPMIQLTYVCSNDRRHQHSTAQEGRRGEDEAVDIMRLTLRDSEGKMAVVDWRLGGDGGLVTDTWMHIVVGIHRTGLTVHENGRKLRSWSFGYPIFQPSTMGGPNAMIPHGYGQRDPMLVTCGETCAGYDYMGISGGGICMCGDSFGPDAEETVCGEAGELCGETPCQDFPVPGGGCTGMLDMLTAMAPTTVVATDDMTLEEATLAWICAEEVHLHNPGAPSGITFGDVCAVSCGTCDESTADELAAVRAQCNGVAATWEITASGGLGPYIGCKSTASDGNAVVPGAWNTDWQTEANAAWPDVDEMDMGGFDIDHTYGDGFDDHGEHYAVIKLTENVTQHTLHLTGSDRGWGDGYWEILSTDIACGRASMNEREAVDAVAAVAATCVNAEGDTDTVCDAPPAACADACVFTPAVEEVVAVEAVSPEDACAAAGVCQMKPDDPESCGPAGHDASKCWERNALDPDCCSMVPECSGGFTAVNSGNACWTSSDGSMSANNYICVSPDTVAPTSVPDCSAFEAGDATTCPDDCVYAAATTACAAATLAGGPEAGRVDEPNQIIEFDWTGASTGGATCGVKPMVQGFCMVALGGTPTENRATCENAGDCSYVPENPLAGARAGAERCMSNAVAACNGVFTDKASCEALFDHGPDGSGCEYRAADSAVTIKISVERWGNYITWELLDSNGGREGSGPRSEPIYLGGMPGLQRGNPMAQFMTPFVGNIADLFIFSRSPDDEQIDCMYRNQQLSLGKCRQPTDMWGNVFWNEMTVAPTRESTAAVPAHCSWDGTCTSPQVQAPGAAFCHDSEENCLGACSAQAQGNWCEAAASIMDPEPTGSCTATAAASVDDTAACAAVTALDDSAACGAASANCAYSPAPFGFPMGPDLFIVGDASIVDGVGLDLRANDHQRTMGDGSFTLMDGLSDSRGALTPEACMIKCKQDGYPYAGLQAGRECWCSDVALADMTTYVPTPDEAASGSDGCTASCTDIVESCVNYDFATTGLMCPGVELGDDTAANEAACGLVNGCVYTGPTTSSRWCGGAACAGDETRNCGGGWRNSVYSTADVADCTTDFLVDDANTCGTGCTFVPATDDADSTADCVPNANDVTAETSAAAYQGCYNDNPSNSFAFLGGRDSDVKEFAQRSRFTISFWFTHNYCSDVTNLGTWETLFSTAGQHCDDAHSEGCEPQDIWIGLKCNENTELSGANGTVMRLIMHDNDGQLVQTDLAVNQEDSLDAPGGVITGAWVHYALVVDQTSVAQYIDGVAARKYGIRWGMSEENGGNLAWHNVSDTGTETISWRRDPVINLRGNGLQGFNFTGREHRMTLGFSFGPWGGSYFNGFMANVGLFRRALDSDEVSCMYKYGETHLGLPPRAWRQGTRAGADQPAGVGADHAHAHCDETPPTCLTELAAISADADHDAFDAVLCAEALDTSTCSADDMLEVAEQLECHCGGDGGR
jgi:hypothetical protein